MRESRTLCVLGVDGTCTDEVGRYLCELCDLPLLQQDEIMYDLSGRRPHELIVMDGEEQYRLWEERACLQMIDRPGVCVINLGILTYSTRFIDKLVADGIPVIHCVADLATICQRIGFNQPRSVALGPIRAQLATFIRERNKLCEDLNPDVTCHTDTSDWRKQLSQWHNRP